MKKKTAIITMLVVALVSASSALLYASNGEGVQTAGVEEDTATGCPGSSCQVTSWTAYGCDSGVTTKCTPYTVPANPQPVTGTCSSYTDGDGITWILCTATRQVGEGVRLSFGDSL